MKTSKLALYVIFLFSVLIISSCGEAPTRMTPVVDIYGAWVEADNNFDDTVLYKSLGLDSSKFGYIFYEDGKLLKRDNAGWCGTPPIYYTNYQGNWNMGGDSIVHITAGYWGGIRSYSFRIISLNATEMKIRYLLD